MTIYGLPILRLKLSQSSVSDGRFLAILSAKRAVAIGNSSMNHVSARIAKDNHIALLQIVAVLQRPVARGENERNLLPAGTVDVVVECQSVAPVGVVVPLLLGARR